MPETRQDITIASGDDRMAGWLYPGTSTASVPGPAIILAHGLGGIKEMRLDVFAGRFQSMGYTAVVFDYRCHGGSTGAPRGLIDFAQQRADWRAAIKYARKLETVDSSRVALFGTSLSGGHVIHVAAEDAKVAAVISQCPFTDGFVSARTIGVKPLPAMMSLGLRDMLFSTKQSTVNVKLAGKPGEAALMNAPDVVDGYHRLTVPAGMEFPETAPARVGLKIMFQRPGTYASKVKCPIFFAICGKDTVAPPGPTLAFAKKAPKGTIKYYDNMGHFSIYVGEDHEKAFKDYEDFLNTNLPV